ncbi:hypothetical protein BDW60DRAFT_221425 [Aspergillus nidulans var. acristatus]
MKLLPLESTLVVIESLVLVLALDFEPDTQGFNVHDYERLPLMLDLATSQSIVAAAGNSWWTSSYIHASDNKPYFIVSHVGNPGPGYYRYSILDISNPNYYQQYAYQGSETDPVSAHISGANITLPTYGFEAVNPADTLAAMRTWSTSGFEFDLTFELSSPVILNGGSGTFTWGPYLTYEWSLVGGITTGNFVVNDTRLTIDPVRSLTWYDRQVVFASGLDPGGSAASQNWTWFQLHYDRPEHRNNKKNSQFRPSKISVWIWDYDTEPRVQFATVHGSEQIAGQQQVLPVTEFTPSGRTWTSPGCGGTYPLDWTIALPDGTRLYIEAIRDDQEFCNASQPFQPTYEGFVSFKGFDGVGNSVVSINGNGFGLGWARKGPHAFNAVLAHAFPPVLALHFIPSRVYQQFSTGIEHCLNVEEAQGPDENAAAERNRETVIARF